MSKAIQHVTEHASKVDEEKYRHLGAVLYEFNNGLSFDDAVNLLIAENANFSEFPLAVLIWK